MTDTITFSQAGQDWLRRLPEEVRRNNKPLSLNTQRAYGFAFARVEKTLGNVALAEINNKLIRDLIAALRKENAKPSTIVGLLNVVKLVCASVTDGNGEPLYPLKLNASFVNLPLIVASEQNTPCATREQVEQALRHPQIAGPVALAAGAGLRVSELLALRAGDCPGCDTWDGATAMIHVRKTLKTPSARRDVPLPAALNGFLQRLSGNPEKGAPLFSVDRNRLYNLLESAGLPPMHSFRRFFATVKDTAGMHSLVLKKVMGHTKGNDITLRYSHAADDPEFVRAEMNRTPLGFRLPELQ